jgi:hypothetical protein
VADIADESIRHGYIALDHLVYVLAKETLYTDVLPELWKKYECDLRNPRTPKVARARDRIGTWKALLYRWAFRTVAGVRSEFKISAPPLPLHGYDKETGDLIDYDMQKMDGPSFVRLDDLKSYFEKTIGLPLPSRLFHHKQPNKQLKGGLSHEKFKTLLVPPIIEKSGRKRDGLATPLPVRGDHGNVFRREGPLWTITYEGKTLKGLRGKGFEVIHFLVQNKNKVFGVIELCQEIDKMDAIIKSSSDNFYLENGHKISVKEGVDGRDIIYGKPFQELKDHLADLKEELHEAEENADIGRIERAERDLDDFERHMSLYFGKDGKSRKFSDEFMKIKERIRKNLAWALNKIKEQDGDTYLHFYNALRPLKSNFYSYRPDRDIDWLTE